MHPESAGKPRGCDCTHETPIYRRVIPFSFALVSRVPSLPTLRGASRENTHVYTCTYMVHVHARDARRAKRRAKESAPRRPELSRSHGSSSGSGGDIPTYLSGRLRWSLRVASASPYPSPILLSLSLSLAYPLSYSRHLRLFDSLLSPPPTRRAL